MRKPMFLILPSILSIAGCKKNVPEAQPFDPKVHYDNVYLIMGQSNASGCSPHSFIQEYDPELYAKYSGEGNEKVKITFDNVSLIDENFVNTKFGQAGDVNFFGPEIGIAESLSSLDETSYIIKATLSGSCLQTQYVDKNGKKLELYDRFIVFIKKQVEKLEQEGKNPRIRGVFWMQGEGDSFDPLYKTYESAQQYFYDYLRSDLNKWIYGYLNFVDAYISTKSPHWPHPVELNAQKQSFCDKNEHGYCIKTNGEDENAILLNLKSESGEDPNDAAHYDSRSMLLLGKTAGNYLIK